MSEVKSWQMVEKGYGFQNSRLSVRYDQVLTPEGRPTTYTFIEKKDFVLVIPKLDDDFILVEQERYTIGQRSWEFVKGGREENEDPLLAAKRELSEETGFRSQKLTSLGYLKNTTGSSNQGYHIFLAEGLIEGERHLDDTESDLIVSRIPISRVVEMIRDGEIVCGETVASYMLYRLHIGAEDRS